MVVFVVLPRRCCRYVIDNDVVGVTSVEPRTVVVQLPVCMRGHECGMLLEMGKQIFVGF